MMGVVCNTDGRDVKLAACREHADVSAVCAHVQPSVTLKRLTPAIVATATNGERETVFAVCWCGCIICVSVCIVCVRLCVCVCVCAFICLGVYIYMYIQIHIHIYV